MVAIAKVILLLLVAFKATAVKTSHEIDSNRELFPHSSPWPSPLSYPPFPSPSLAPYAAQELDTAPPPVVLSPPPPEDHHHGIDRALCIAKCGISCLKKKSFLRDVCFAICIAKCAIRPTDSPDNISCTVDCAQSSTNSLRYDASMMEDRVSSCYQQCKRD